MNHYGLYWKTLKRFIPQAMIYIVFFVILCVVNIKGSWNEHLISAGYKIGWSTEEESPLVSRIEERLKQNEQIEILVQKDVNNEKMTDALMLDVVDYIIHIPEGFSESILSSQPLELEIWARREDERLQKIEQMIEDTIQDWINNPETDDTYIVPDGKVENGEIIKSRRDDGLRINFNQMIYGLSAVIFVGVLSVTYSINEEKVRIRKQCAPYQERERLFLLKGHMIYASICLILFWLLALLFDPKNFFSFRGLMWCFNSILLMFNIVAIAYLFSLFVKDIYVQMMVTNVVTLAVNFISGTTIEQEYLSETSIKIAQFLPTYWYVKANNLIADIGSLAQLKNKSLMNAIRIEILFILTLGVITLVIQEQIEEKEEILQ
ncbi:MAG: ABC transporter permease [Cellulosilyticum sp.]|nr:ABC transporter permease [Cellulosilyticum sp.]